MAKEEMSKEDMKVLLTSILEYIRKCESKAEAEQFIKELLKATK